MKFARRISSRAALYHQSVNGCDRDEPWYERRIFHRVPSPESSPSQRLISPESAERDSESKDS